MKKLSILVGAITLTSSLFAQDLTSKKGEAYLPEQGDWAIGIDALPFLNYFGNFIGGNGANVAPSWDFQTTNSTITGKYFVEEKMAYRGSLRLGFGSNSQSMMVSDRSLATPPTFPNAPALKENSMKSGGTNIGLAGGLEWRKGNTRLQGFYGGELGFMMGSGKDTYTYGNNLNPTGTPAVVVDGTDDAFNGGANIGTDAYGNTSRTTESKTSMIGFGLRGFIGAEYFVLPKLSIGGEFGWGLAFMSGKSEVTAESTGSDINGNQVVGTLTTEGAKMGGFGIDTDRNTTVFGNAGSIRIVLHF